MASHQRKTIKTSLRPEKSKDVVTQLTKNVSGTFGFGFMKVWLNLTLLERNAYVRRFSYKCLVEPNVLKTLFKYSDSVQYSNEMQKAPNEYQNSKLVVKSL